MSESRILLVDDEEELRRSSAQALELAGFRVDTFACAEDALERIAFSFHGVVISDIRMPGMDGMTFLQRIREIDAELPVILVTGHGDVQLAVRAMREGAYDFVEKPSPPRCSPAPYAARSIGALSCSRTAGCGLSRGSATT